LISGGQKAILVKQNPNMKRIVLMQKNTKPFLTTTAAVYILAIISCMLWGSAFPSIKTGYALLGIASADTASQILFAGVRFTLSGALTILIFSIAGKRFLLPKKSDLGKVLKLGSVQTVMQYLFFYVGLATATAAKSSIISGTGPFFAIILASFLFRQERFTKAKLLGSLLGFAGIVIINLDLLNFTPSFSFAGEGFILLSTVAYALSASMIRLYSKDADPVVLSGYQFLLGGVILVATGLFAGGSLHFSGAGAVLILVYLALISAVAYTLWALLLKHNPVSRVAVFGFMIPVFGVLFSTLFLHEDSQATALQTVVSLALVSAGIIVINKFQNQKSLPTG
jgi:drug/metabolite transporter (DMT)-like permease